MKSLAVLKSLVDVLKGGQGSGNFGHSGIPGQRGGSGGGGGESGGTAPEYTGSPNGKDLAAYEKENAGKPIGSKDMNGKPLNVGQRVRVIANPEKYGMGTYTTAKVSAAGRSGNAIVRFDTSGKGESVPLSRVRGHY